MKITENFEDTPLTNNNEAKLLTTQYFNKKGTIQISKCNFEINENDQCSLFYVYGNKPIRTEVSDCTFTGKLSKNSHHVDGHSNDDAVPKINFQNCKFSSDSKHALNQKAIKVELKNQVFNYGSIKENQSMKVLICIATSGVLCVAIISALIWKKKNSINNESNEIYDQSLIINEVQTIL